MSQPASTATIFFVDDETAAMFAAQLRLENAARLIRDAFAFAVAGTGAITFAATLLS